MHQDPFDSDEPEEEPNINNDHPLFNGELLFGYFQSFVSSFGSHYDSNTADDIAKVFGFSNYDNSVWKSVNFKINKLKIDAKNYNIAHSAYLIKEPPQYCGLFNNLN